MQEYTVRSCAYNVRNRSLINASYLANTRPRIAPAERPNVSKIFRLERDFGSVIAKLFAVPPNCYNDIRLHRTKGKKSRLMNFPERHEGSMLVIGNLPSDLVFVILKWHHSPLSRFTALTETQNQKGALEPHFTERRLLKLVS